MATFAKKTFDAAAYLKYRPTYPQSLIQHVIDYARPPSGGIALDLGCGPGQATTLLAASGAFRKVIGVDPSKGMIDAAISTLKRDPSALVESSLTQDALAETEYRVGSAEKLDWIQDASVDLVTAAQAAHWFKHGDVYAELQRILRPGGTVAYIGYGYMHFPQYPSATPKIHNFGLKKLGPYWEPGRNGPDSLYDLVPFPSSDAQGWDRSSFIRNKLDQGSSKAYIELNGDNPAPPETKHFPIAMKKTLDFEGIRRSLYTWSSVHTYMEKHKPAMHVVDDFMDSLKEELPENGAIDVAWPTGVLLMKKKTE